MDGPRSVVDPRVAQARVYRRRLSAADAIVVPVYTDGSGQHSAYAHHLRTAGYGVYWGEDDPRNIAAPLTGPLVGL